MILTFSFFYITGSIGLFFTILYNLLIFIFNSELADIVRILHYIAIAFIVFSFIFALNFCLILYKGEDVFSIQKQAIITIAYGIILSFGILIQDGVTITSTGVPVWNLYYFLFFVVSTIMTLFPTLYYSIKISKQFDDNTLRRKWNFFIIGLICLYICLYGTCIFNTFIFPLSLQIWSIILIFLIPSSAYCLYYAVATKFNPAK